MTIIRKQSLLIGAILCYVLACTVISLKPNHSPETESVELIAPEASFFQEGNVQSRADYEREMLVDPKTGQLPNNIRQEELKFAKALTIENERLRVRMNRLSVKGGQRGTSMNLWTSIGPQNYGGRTRALALDIQDENTILAGGVSGGVWRSTNGGQSWLKTTSPDQIQSVTAITQDVRLGQEDVWYYGTGELVGNSGRAPGAPFRGDGIFKSVDGGLSWQPIVSTQSVKPDSFVSPFQYVWDITTDPASEQNVILAAVFGGIVRSEDGGETWSTVLGDDLLSGVEDLNDIPAIFYTDIHRAADGVFYASLSNVTNFSGQQSRMGGVYSSIDGIVWSQIMKWDALPVQRTEISASPSNPNIVYFLADLTIRGYGLWKYDRRNGSIVDLSSNLPDGNTDLEELESQESYNFVVKVHPDDPNVVFVGGTNLYRSTDGFKTKENVRLIGGYKEDDSSGSGVYPGHHPDQHDLAFLPSDSDIMISANDGGLFKSDDNMAEEVVYTSLNRGYLTTQFYTVAISKFQPDDYVTGGTQDNGSILTENILARSQPNGTRVIGGDGGFTASTPFGVYYYMSFQNSNIYRLTLNAESQLTSFARVDPIGGGSDPSQSYLFINPYILDPNYANRMYLAGGDHIWRNQNLSQIPSGSQQPTSVNWDKLEETEIAEGTISALQVSTNPRNILYFGTSNGQLYKVENAHSELYEVTDITSSSFSSEGYIRSIAVDPTDANHILVAFSNYNIHSIYRSVDGGESFHMAAGNLEGDPTGAGTGPSVRWVSIVPKTSGEYEYYAGTSIGLFSTTSIEEGVEPVWVQESPESIGNTIVNMIDYRQVDGKIAVATHGGGLYTSQIASVVQNDNLVEVDKLEVQTVYPNPFSEKVLIKINSPDTRFVIMRIYDTNGNEVKRITSSLAFQGENDFFWNGTNNQEQPVSSGLYIIRITHEGGEESKRVILQRN